MTLLDPRDPAAWRAEPFEAEVERRLRSLEDWRLEMRTAFKLLQLTFGTSVLAAAAAILSLIGPR